MKLYLDQNLAAQENILKALTEANVQYATVRKGLIETEQKYDSKEYHFGITNMHKL